jgi:hypothetical protein
MGLLGMDTGKSTFINVVRTDYGEWAWSGWA